MTSHGDENLAVEIMKSGAIDYIVKSATVFKDLPRIVLRALREWENFLQRRKAEDADRDSQKRVADIIGFLPDAVLAIDGNGTVIAWNSAMEALTGVSADSMLGKGDYEYSLPFYGERRPILIDLVLAQDAGIEKRYNYFRREGDRMTSETFIPGMSGGKGAYLWGTASPLYDAAGNRIGAIEVIRDITERKKAEDSLKRDEEILTLFIRHSPAALAMFDREMRYLAASNRWIADYHLETREITGKSHYEIFPEISPEIRAVHRRCLAGEVISSAGDRFVRADGTIQWVSWEVRPWREPDDTIGGIIIFSENITERKNAEEALAAREATLKTVLNAPEDSIALLDHQGIILDINEAGARRLGKSPEELTGIVVYGLLPPELARTRKDHIDQVFATAKPGMFDDERNGRIFHNEVFPVFSSDPGTVDHVAIFARDVTSQKQAEHSLQESERKYRFLVDNVRDIVWQATPGLVFTYLSPAAEALTGWTATELMGKPLTSLLTEKSAAYVRDRLSQRMEEARSQKEISATVFEIEVRRKDGNIRWFEVSSNPVFGPYGAFSGFQGIARDITERKQAEQALRESDTRFRDLFNNMTSGVVVYRMTEDGKDFIISDINHAVEVIEQVKKDEILEKSLLSVFPGVKEFGLFDVLKRVAVTGTAEAFPVRLYQDNRISGWRENYVYRLPSGEVVAIFEDVTGKKLAEERLRESRQILEGILNTIPVRVFWKDKDLTYLGCNTAFAQDAGFEKAEDIVGKDDYAMGWREQADLYRADDRAVIESGNAKLMIEEPQTTPSGETIYLLTSKMPLRDVRGDNIGVLGTYLDITDRKKAEERLRLHSKILETMSEGVSLVRSEDGVIVYTNPRFDAMFGYAAGELEGRHVSDINAASEGQSPQEVAEAIMVKLRTRGIWIGEILNRKKDGSTCWCRATVTSFVHPEFGPVWITTQEDITGRKQAERTREQYAARLDAAMEIGSLAWWEMDLPEGNVRFDDRKAAMLGYSPEHFHHYRDFTTLLHPDDNEPAMQAMRDHLEGRQARYTADYRIRTSSGEYRWFRDVGGITKRHPDGTPATVTGIVIDITASRQADEALHRASRYNRSLIEASPDPLVTIGPDGKITDVNASTEQVTGYPRDRLIGTDFSDYFTEPEKARTGYRKVFSDGEVRDYPLEIHHRDGHTIPVLYNASVFRDESGKVAGVFAAARDITERRLSEAALRDSEERYRTLVEEMPDLVIVHRNGELLYVNAAIIRMLGSTAEDLLHTSIMDYIAPESKKTILTAMEKREKGGSIAPYIVRLILPDGSTRWVEIRGASIMFEGLPASFNVLTDITDRKWAEDALFESEKKFRTVSDYTYDWEYWVGKDGNFIYVSPSCERISGYAPDDFYRDKDLLRQLIPDQDRTILEEHNASLSNSPDTQPIEFRITTKDGRTVWIGHVCQPVFSPEGEYLGRRGTNRDITERKAAEDALRASEVRFRSLIQNSSDIIRILDKDRKIIYESSSSDRILGYPAGFFIGKDPRELIHPDDSERVRGDFREVLDRTNAGIPTEFRIRKADGSYLWVDAVGTNLLGVAGVDGIVITIRPIEQRKRMEDELRENQIRLATAMDMASLVNWDFDVKTGMFTFNDRFYALYGTTAEREGGYLMPAETYVREFVHPDDVAYSVSVIGNVASVTDPDYSAEIEHRIIRRDGGMRYIMVRFGVIMDSDGKVVRTRGANQDITSQKMMESEIRSLNRSLEQRVDQRTEELNKSLQEKELLLREIHHRVKNNLQIIISILRLQKRHITDAGTISALMDGESRVRSMALVHEKLYRSKDLEHIDVGDYLKALTQYLFTTYAVEQRRIAFKVVMSDISLDIQRAIPIGLILNELIANALKHAFPGGRNGEVRIAGKKEEDRILIFIEDNGAGFPEGLDWRHTQSLGMHLVMTLIEQVRGTIEIETGSGGTRFTLSIPVHGGKGP
jgi:PAS domain S-box-containing protein